MKHLSTDCQKRLERLHTAFQHHGVAGIGPKDLPDLEAWITALQTQEAPLLPPLFDASFWAENNGNKAMARGHGFLHFCEHWLKTRQPFHPFVHIPFLEFGLRTPLQNQDPLSAYYGLPPSDRPSPHPLFDAAWYRSVHDISDHWDAFDHFIVRGMDMGLAPNPYAFQGFDSENCPIPKAVIQAYLLGEAQ